MERIADKLARLLHFSYEPPPVHSGEIAFAAEDVDRQLIDDKNSSLFLGHFTRAQLEQALEDVGIVRQLRAKGYRDPVLVTSAPDRFVHRLDLYDGHTAPDRLIGEIVVRVGIFRPETRFFSTPRLDRLELLFIEWILMQDIRGTFTPDRRRLPGQVHPGLGVGRAVVRLLERACHVLGLEGVLNCPEYFHNARFYETKGGFHFYDPHKAGEVSAVARDLAKMDIADLSLAIHLGCVRNRETGEPYRWEAGEQILPLTERVREYFACADYRRIAATVAEVCEFELDAALFAARRAREGRD